MLSLFAKNMQHLNLDSEAIFLCPFDITRLFTNISLKGTIQIEADTLYKSEFIPPTIPKALFAEILSTATTSIEFSFNNTMHKQIDGVAMGSPLGPILANMFVGYYK